MIGRDGFQNWLQYLLVFVFVMFIVFIFAIVFFVGYVSSSITLIKCSQAHNSLGSLFESLIVFVFVIMVLLVILCFLGSQMDVHSGERELFGTKIWFPDF